MSTKTITITTQKWDPLRLGDVFSWPMKGKTWWYFYKIIDYHPLEKCYGYFYAEGIIEKTQKL